MTLARWKGGEAIFAASPPGPTRPLPVPAAVRGADWHQGFELAHWRAVMALLVALLMLGIMAPATLAGSAGGAVLLGGGALIGMPHGSSDFVVAHRLLRPRLRLWWLPVFLVAYLAVTGAVLLGWRFAPETTFMAFLAVSSLHFGASRNDPVRPGTATLRYLVRAATPVVPIFLFHPGDVAGIIGLMCGRPASSIITVLNGLRPVGLSLYLALLVVVIAQALLPRRFHQRSFRPREAVELILLAAAAALLPPLLVFALYFCLLHAVRHMAELGHDTFPGSGRAALGLAAAIVIPSALFCTLVLSFAWDAIAGALTTEHVLAIALQVTASLTVPHVILEGWADHHSAAA